MKSFISGLVLIGLFAAMLRGFFVTEPAKSMHVATVGYLLALLIVYRTPSKP